MKISYFVPFVLAAAVASGCRNEPQQTSTTSTPPASTATSTTTAAATTSSAAPSAYDLQFIDSMSRHHQGAVQMAKAAQAKVQLPELKQMTKRIPEAQQKEIDQMKAWRDQWYPGAPPAAMMQMEGSMGMGMGSSMNMDMSHMESMKAGKAFDAMFIDMMIPHHEAAIQMAKDALTKAEHAEIKTLAQQIIDQQQKEVDSMKQWKSKLGS